MTRKDNFFNQARDRAQRIRNNVPQRKPLKTFDEIAEMLNVSVQKLRRFMQDPSSPKVIFKTRNSTNRLNYYDEDDFKTWWASIPKEKT